MTTPLAPTLNERLGRLARQFLVHSFLYYRLGETVIGDSAFDLLTEELRALRQANPDAALPYAGLLEPLLGPEASGHRIAHYPPEIISTAFKLLYATSGAQVDFAEFTTRRGYTVQLHPSQGR